MFNTFLPFNMQMFLPLYVDTGDMRQKLIMTSLGLSCGGSRVVEGEGWEGSWRDEEGND